VRLELGTTVRCADDAIRELVDVVIDSSSNRVTHVVVQPENRPERARLVPMELVVGGADEGETISLRCTSGELEKLEPVREFAYLRPGEVPDEKGKWDVGVEDVVATPQYAPSDFGGAIGGLDPGVGVTYDRVPKGEVELRHASGIYSADRHHLGRVDGVLVDAAGRVTDLLLERGHLWWRREMVIPAEAVAKFETDAVTLATTKKELGA
jgi:uncharacterized protein YrrD